MLFAGGEHRRVRCLFWSSAPPHHGMAGADREPPARDFDGFAFGLGDRPGIIP
jgi:hypothetical protein